MQDFFENIKSKTKPFAIGLLFFLGWITVIALLVDSVAWYELGYFGDFLESIVSLFGVAIPIVVFILIKGYKARCSECKKLFAVKEIETRLVDKKPDYFTQINNTYSAYDGRVTHRSEQRILGTRKYYKTLHVCKYCNAKFFTSYSECTDEIWQDEKKGQ